MPATANAYTIRPDQLVPLPPVRTFGVSVTPLEVSDEQIIEGLRRQEPEMLECLYERYHRLAFALATRILGDSGMAEEVVQEAFLSAWRHAGSYRPERASVKTWLTSIVHHRAIDRLRSRVIHDPLDTLETAPASPLLPDVADLAIQNMEGEKVRAALLDLPQEQRQAITLAYFSGWTHVEIAGHAGVPVGTVKGRLRLGLEKMRRSLSA